MALCPPLLGFVTTAPVSEGDELCQTYGHSYWLGTDVYAAGDAASELAEISALQNREKDMWQVATDKKHGAQIRALSDLIAGVSAELAGDDGGGVEVSPW